MRFEGILFRGFQICIFFASVLFVNLGSINILFAESFCARALSASFSTRSEFGRPSRIFDLNSATIQNLLTQADTADRIIILADHDGTFKEHEADSESVWPTSEDLALVQALQHHPKIEFHFVTGRPMDWFFKRYGEFENIGISANHGIAEKQRGQKVWSPLEGIAEDWKRALPLLENALKRIPKSRIEHKIGFVFHWKEAESLGPISLLNADKDARDLYAVLNANFDGQPGQFAWSDKGRYFEILPDDPRIGKGHAALRILTAALGPHLSTGENVLVITAGDEGSDNEMHSVVRELSHRRVGLSSFSLKIGENHLDHSTAEFWMPYPQQFQEILKKIMIKP